MAAGAQTGVVRIIIPLTKAMTEAAAAYAAAVQATPTLQAPNYTRLSAAGRYRVGYLGEAAVAAALHQRSIRFDWTPRADGAADNSDLIIYSGGAAYACEVKTCSKPSHQYLMQPLAQQLRRGNRGIIVAVRLNERVGFAEIVGCIGHVGFAQRSEVVHPPDRGVRVPTRLLSLNLLTPLEALLRRLDRSDVDAMRV